MTSAANLISVIQDRLTEGASAVGVPVSADIRQRGDDVPAVIYDVDFEPTVTALGQIAPVLCTVTVQSLAESRLDADDLDSKVTAAFHPESGWICHKSTSTPDLFSRGADIEPVYITSSVFMITCEEL